MSAYFIAQIRVDDTDEYKKYLVGFMPILRRHQGELLTISADKTEVFEGEWALPQTVLMRFPSRDKAQAWYADPEYQAISQHRHKSAATNMVLVDGVDV